MAKQSYGILDGYRGTVGPVIGYQWRGKWCLRARPRKVHNPQTEAQQEHRMLFRDMVQLASQMKQGLRMGLHTASMEEQMTECNLFVKMNKDRFTPQGIDYSALEISRGPVAPVAFTYASVDENNVLHTSFEKNPLRMRADNDDEVRVYAFCPAQQDGRLSTAVQRRCKHLEMALPDEWAGLEVHFYAFVEDYKQQTSETIYLSVETSCAASTLNNNITYCETNNNTPSDVSLQSEGGIEEKVQTEAVGNVKKTPEGHFF